MVKNTPWVDSGLPSALELRTSLDAGPVYSIPNPVIGGTGICGSFVNRAARIEPITPPNEVYASEAFASLYAATGGTAYHFDYVGQTKLPKGYGMTPLYCLRK